MVVLAVLVIALALLWMILGFYLLVFVGLTGLALSLGNLLAFILLAAATGLALLFAGSLLDRRLDRDLTAFIARTGPSPLRDRGLTRAYGLLVLSLLPYFLYLQGFALYVVLAVSMDVLRSVVENSQVPLILLLGPAIIVVGTVVGIAIGMIRLVVLPTVEPVGLAVTADDDPFLWDLSQRAANSLGTQPADVIVLTPEPGIGVSMPVGLFRVIFGGRRTLQIGLPSICGLRVDELAAILTHEYGHFGHRDAQWAAFIHALGVSLLATLEAVPGPWSFGEQPTILALVASLNPAYWTMRIFVALFFRLTAGFSRARETHADLEAAARLGGRTFAGALLRVAANDVVFRDLIEERDIPRLLAQREIIPGFLQWMELIYRNELGEVGLAAIEYKLFAAGRQHASTDSHPGLEERIDATVRIRGDGLTDGRPVAALFDDWRGTDETLTRLYYRTRGWTIADERAAPL